MTATETSLWLASIGDALVWARLRVFESGRSEIFAADGRTLAFDSFDAARTALLDAEFRALDGLDEDDACAMGFDLNDIAPPAADDDDAGLLPLMTQMLSD